MLQLLFITCKSFNLAQRIAVNSTCILGLPRIIYISHLPFSLPKKIYYFIEKYDLTFNGLSVITGNFQFWTFKSLSTLTLEYWHQLHIHSTEEANTVYIKSNSYLTNSQQENICIQEEELKISQPRNDAVRRTQSHIPYIYGEINATHEPTHQNPAKIRHKYQMHIMTKVPLILQAVS